ncbi:MAG TPA: hypothetical protein VM577_07315 [Anaerovoracaceae bacterium]|nr:hypothetical protein [Anaerovoracaceae bacterium]
MNGTAYLFYGVEIAAKSKDIENLENVLDKRDDFELIFLGVFNPPQNHGKYYLAYKKSITAGEAVSLAGTQLIDFDIDEEMIEFCKDYKVTIREEPQWWLGSCFSV